jgi:uncharacterized protein with PQ loop repeat
MRTCTEVCLSLIEIFIADAVLFWLPYLPATLALLSARTETSIKAHWYITAQVLVCLFVAVAYIYATAVAPFNGLIDIGKLRIPSGLGTPLHLDVWTPAKYLMGVYGILACVLVFRKANHQRREGEPFAIWLFFGGFCLVYGFAVPFLMQSMLSGILDSHLM